MTSDTGDASSRLSSALDEILSGRRGEHDDEPTEDDADASADALGGAYVLPEIVPATVDVPVVESPRLPDRSANVQPATAEYPTTEPAAGAAPAPVAHAVAPAGGVAPSAPQIATTEAPAASGVPATAWGDHMPVARPQQLRNPGRRPRVRRVTRVLRHIDPWSTFKIAILFNAVAYVVCLTSGVLLWRVADSTGTLDNVERWFTQFGWETFELKGEEVFHNAWVIGLFAVVAATGAAVLLVTLFNLVSDIVGGIRLTVLEEEVVERTISSTRRYVVRRPGDIAMTGAVATDWSADDLDSDEPADRSSTDSADDGSADDTGSAGPATTDWSVD